MALKLSILFFYLFVSLVWSAPVNYGNELQEANPASPLISILSGISAAAILILLVLVLGGCTCCQNQGFKNFTEHNGIQLPQQNSHNRGVGNFETLQADSEFTIFPPVSAKLPYLTGNGETEPVTFEPLPDIRPRSCVPFEHPVPSGQLPRPAYFKAAVTHGLSLHDWFNPVHGGNFPRSRLQYLQELGVGWYGQAVEGEAQQIIAEQRKSRVIVKILREDASPSEHMYFLHEVQKFRDLRHPNILKLLGQCLETDPFLILLEHCQTDLKSYLISQRSSSEDLLQGGRLLEMACQLTLGVQHMHSKGFIHTDLAARNCLLDQNLQLKIGDYGTSYSVYPEDYYIVGEVAIPLRWSAPETLLPFGKSVDTKEVLQESNLWSFGITLWEMMELGKQPYMELSDEQVLQQVVSQQQTKLEEPKTACLHRTLLYQVMQQCWGPPETRPTISKVQALLSHLQQNREVPPSLAFEERWQTLQHQVFVPRQHNLKFTVSESDTPPLVFESHFNPKSASLQNLRGSLEDIVLRQEQEEEEDKVQHQITLAIQELDDFLANEITTSEISSNTATPEQKEEEWFPQKESEEESDGDSAILCSSHAPADVQSHGTGDFTSLEDSPKSQEPSHLLEYVSSSAVRSPPSPPPSPSMRCGDFGCFPSDSTNSDAEVVFFSPAHTLTLLDTPPVTPDALSSSTACHSRCLTSPSTDAGLGHRQAADVYAGLEGNRVPGIVHSVKNSSPICKQTFALENPKCDLTSCTLQGAETDSSLSNSFYVKNENAIVTTGQDSDFRDHWYVSNSNSFTSDDHAVNTSDEDRMNIRNDARSLNDVLTSQILEEKSINSVINVDELKGPFSSDISLILGETISSEKSIINSFEDNCAKHNLYMDFSVDNSIVSDLSGCALNEIDINFSADKEKTGKLAVFDTLWSDNELQSMSSKLVSEESLLKIRSRVDELIDDLIASCIKIACTMAPLSEDNGPQDTGFNNDLIAGLHSISDEDVSDKSETANNSGTSAYCTQTQHALFNDGEQKCCDCDIILEHECQLTDSNQQICEDKRSVEQDARVSDFSSAQEDSGLEIERPFISEEDQALIIQSLCGNDSSSPGTLVGGKPVEPHYREESHYEMADILAGLENDEVVTDRDFSPASDGSDHQSAEDCTLFLEDLETGNREPIRCCSSPQELLDDELLIVDVETNEAMMLDPVLRTFHDQPLYSDFFQTDNYCSSRLECILEESDDASHAYNDDETENSSNNIQPSPGNVVHSVPPDLVFEGDEVLAGDYNDTDDDADINSSFETEEEDEEIGNDVDVDDSDDDEVEANEEFHFQIASPFESTDKRTDEAYTPDFDSDTDDTSSSTGTSRSSSSGSFECPKEVVQSPVKIFSTTWDSTLTPTKSAIKSPEKLKQSQEQEPVAQSVEVSVSEMKKSVSFHEEDPMVVYSYPPAESDEDSDGNEDVAAEEFAWHIDYTNYADWEFQWLEEEIPEEEMEETTEEEGSEVQAPRKGTSHSNFQPLDMNTMMYTLCSEDMLDSLDSQGSLPSITEPLSLTSPSKPVPSDNPELVSDASNEVDSQHAVNLSGEVSDGLNERETKLENAIPVESTHLETEFYNADLVNIGEHSAANCAVTDTPSTEDLLQVHSALQASEIQGEVQMNEASNFSTPELIDLNRDEKQRNDVTPFGLSGSTLEESCEDQNLLNITSIEDSLNPRLNADGYSPIKANLGNEQVVQSTADPLTQYKCLLNLEDDPITTQEHSQYNHIEKLSVDTQNKSCNPTSFKSANEIHIVSDVTVNSDDLFFITEEPYSMNFPQRPAKRIFSPPEFERPIMDSAIDISGVHEKLTNEKKAGASGGDFWPQRNSIFADKDNRQEGPQLLKLNEDSLRQAVSTPEVHRPITTLEATNNRLVSGCADDVLEASNPVLVVDGYLTT